MSDLPQHPLIDAVKPVLDMLGAHIIPVEDALISDRALEWDGEIIAAVRLPHLQGALDRLIATEIGRAHVWTPVTDVSRMPSSA